MWKQISGGVTAPQGFQAAGLHAGLKPSGKKDLALLLAPEDAICAGTFTKSLVRAACIDLCKERLKNNSGKARAVLINSGQANACIGDRAVADNLRVTQTLADRLRLNVEEVLIASTGVIGVPLPVEKLLAGIDPLVAGLNSNGGMHAATAILTTDLVDKQIAFEANLSGRVVRIGGMAKGSGMIHPDMATMLGFITCDAGLPIDIFNRIVHRAVGSSFNAITVDGDTSTNDLLLAFSSGEQLDSKNFNEFEIGITAVFQYLAKSIARDGEGASCLIEVTVEGAVSDAIAMTLARTICSSSLVKTAVHGCDPNWGRIVAAAGRSGVEFVQKELSLWIGEYQLVQFGEPINFDLEAVILYMGKKNHGKYLTDDSVVVRLAIGSGAGSATAWGCDLSEQYVKINADYTT